MEVPQKTKNRMIPHFYSWAYIWRKLKFKNVHAPLCSWLPSQLSWYSICLQSRKPRFNSWVGKLLWRRKWKPTPVFLPGESHGRGAQQATIHEVTRVGHDLATKPPTPVSIAALCTIAKTWNQPEQLSTDEWIKKMQYIYTVEYYSAIKRMICSHLQQHGCNQRLSD